MTCRHSAGDPACSSNQYRYESGPTTPDASKYEIDEAEQIGPHLVIRARYPNCRACSYEGVKVMVYLDVSTKDALRWRTIDPHFTDPKTKRLPTEAPGPAARFPGSAQGWSDALAYARSKVVPR